MESYYVLAFYIFTPISDPREEVRKHHDFFRTRDIRSRVYISHEGINGQMSALESHAIEYMEWVKGDERFKEIDFKIHIHPEHAFPKTTVKYKEQLVALDRACDLTQAGKHLSASEWKQMLCQKDNDTIVIDVRNDYEWVIGHFEGALKPALDTFRKFPEYVDALKKEYNPATTKVMMYCTGGIRCEKASSFMMSEGFDEVYHLEGGILKYLEEVKPAESLWQGECFVFDQRVAVKDGLAVGNYDQCYACRYPLSADDTKSDKYTPGISCPHCYNKHTPEKLKSLTERQKQVILAKQKGKKHIA